MGPIVSASDQLPGHLRWFAPWLWMRWQSWLTLGLLLMLYSGPYVVLSRRGYAEARKWDVEGFYYLSPENSDEWEFWNYTLVYVFYPLNQFDQMTGHGRPPGCVPLFEIE